MGMTITGKTLVKHAQRKSAAPGEIINARVDLVFANEIIQGIWPLISLKKQGLIRFLTPTG
jgi:hypothetical protein